MEKGYRPAPESCSSTSESAYYFGNDFFGVNVCGKQSTVFYRVSLGWLVIVTLHEFSDQGDGDTSLVC